MENVRLIRASLETAADALVAGKPVDCELAKQVLDALDAGELHHPALWALCSRAWDKIVADWKARRAQSNVVPFPHLATCPQSTAEHPGP
jgi:hypothetical protein